MRNARSRPEQVRRQSHNGSILAGRTCAEAQCDHPYPRCPHTRPADHPSRPARSCLVVSSPKPLGIPGWLDSRHDLCYGMCNCTIHVQLHIVEILHGKRSHSASVWQLGGERDYCPLAEAARRSCRGRRAVVRDRDRQGDGRGGESGGGSHAGAILRRGRGRAGTDGDCGDRRARRGCRAVASGRRRAYRSRCSHSPTERRRARFCTYQRDAAGRHFAARPGSGGTARPRAREPDRLRPGRASDRARYPGRHTGAAADDPARPCHGRARRVRRSSGRHRCRRAHHRAGPPGAGGPRPRGSPGP